MNPTDTNTEIGDDEIVVLETDGDEIVVLETGDGADGADGADGGDGGDERTPAGAATAAGPARVADGGEQVLDVFDDVVDDRMRRRWIDARRAEGRRRLRILCAIVGVLAVGAIAWVIADSSLLGADTVDVRGNHLVPAAEIRAAAHVADGSPLLFLDQAAVGRRVERLPLVATASVSTELPSTVVVEVTERVPVAWTAARAAPAVAVLDRDGRVLQRVGSPPAGLPEVTGAGDPGNPGTRVRRADVLGALAALPAELRAQTQRLDLTASGPVLLLGGPNPVAREVDLGSFDRLELKGSATLALLASLRAQGEQVRVIRVVVPEAPTTSG